MRAIIIDNILVSLMCAEAEAARLLRTRYS